MSLENIIIEFENNLHPTQPTGQEFKEYLINLVKNVYNQSKQETLAEVMRVMPEREIKGCERTKKGQINNQNSCGFMNGFNSALSEWGDKIKNII